MTDLVQSLRKLSWDKDVQAIADDAADRIEALQARIDAIMPRLDEVVEMGNRLEELAAVLKDLRDDPMEDPPAYWNWKRTAEYWKECAKFWRFNAGKALETLGAGNQKGKGASGLLETPPDTLNPPAPSTVYQEK